MTEAIDIDALFAAEQAKKGKSATEVEYRVLRYRDRDWRVREEPNAALNLAMSDGTQGGTVAWLIGFVHPDERYAFRQALETDETLVDAKLTLILDTLTKKWAGLPLAPSDDSSDSPPATGESSTASGSSEPAQQPAGTWGN